MDLHGKKKVQIKAVNYMENLSIRQINGLARGNLGRTSRILSVNVYTEILSRHMQLRGYRLFGYILSGVILFVCFF